MFVSYTSDSVLGCFIPSYAAVRSAAIDLSKLTSHELQFAHLPRKLRVDMMNMWDSFRKLYLLYSKPRPRYLNILPEPFLICAINALLH